MTWSTSSLDWGNGLSYGVNTYLSFYPSSGIWYLLTLIYKFQPGIIIMAGYVIAEFFQSWLSSVQVLSNYSMHKLSIFPFLSDMLSFPPKICQSNFSHWFFFKWYTDQLSHLECLYTIPWFYSLRSYPPSSPFLLPFNFLVPKTLSLQVIWMIGLLFCTETHRTEENK